MCQNPMGEVYLGTWMHGDGAAGAEKVRAVAKFHGSHFFGQKADDGKILPDGHFSSIPARARPSRSPRAQVWFGGDLIDVLCVCMMRSHVLCGFLSVLVLSS